MTAQKRIRWNLVWEKAFTFAFGILLLTFVYSIVLAIGYFIASYSC